MAVAGMLYPQRQQKVILGIRNKVLSPENFPALLGKAQQFYEEFSAGIKTNMPFDTAIQLGVLARDIPVETIKQGVIDYTMVSLGNTTLGGEAASVMKPLPDKIRELRDEVFTSGGAVSPLADQADPTALMQSDGSRVRVLNGSFSPGLDVSTGNYLISLGVPVTEVGTAERAYDRSIAVVTHGGVIRTLICLALGLSPKNYLLFDARPGSLAVLDLHPDGAVLTGLNL